MRLLSFRDAVPQVRGSLVFATVVLVAFLIAPVLVAAAAEDDADVRGKKHTAVRSALEKRVEKLRKEEREGKKNRKGRKRSKGERRRLVEHLQGLRESGHINPTSIAVIDDDFAAVAQATSEQIEAPAAHKWATGSGVTVAVLDGGFNTTHPMIAGRISPYGYDAVDRDYDPNDGGNGVDGDRDGQIDEGLGHGTFVAAMVLQAAPGATILPVRVADDEGNAGSDQIADGIEYAIRMNVDVINLSLEAGEKSTRVSKLLALATKAGIVIVASAGNDAEEVEGLIAERPDTISVGAVDQDDDIASFSNFSNKKVKVTIFAPGVDLYGPVGWPTKTTMGLGSGTSFSAGLVSGAVALYLELHPAVAPKDVRRAISLAVDYVVDGQAAGRLNLEKVVGR